MGAAPLWSSDVDIFVTSHRAMAAACRLGNQFLAALHTGLDITFRTMQPRDVSRAALEMYGDTPVWLREFWDSRVVDINVEPENGIIPNVLTWEEHFRSAFSAYMTTNNPSISSNLGLAGPAGDWPIQALGCDKPTPSASPSSSDSLGSHMSSQEVEALLPEQVEGFRRAAVTMAMRGSSVGDDFSFLFTHPDQNLRLPRADVLRVASRIKMHEEQDDGTQRLLRFSNATRNELARAIPSDGVGQRPYYVGPRPTFTVDAAHHEILGEYPAAFFDKWRELESAFGKTAPTKVNVVFAVFRNGATAAEEVTRGFDLIPSQVSMTAKEVAFAEFLAPRAGYSGGFAFALSDRTRLCIGCGSIQLTEFAINFGNAIERELELDPSLDSWDHRACGAISSTRL